MLVLRAPKPAKTHGNVENVENVGTWAPMSEGPGLRGKSFLSRGYPHDCQEPGGLMQERSASGGVRQETLFSWSNAAQKKGKWMERKRLLWL